MVSLQVKPKDERKQAKLWKDRVLVLIDKLKENDMLRQWLHKLRDLPPPTYTDTQWEILGSITRLLPYAVAELQACVSSTRQSGLY